MKIFEIVCFIIARNYRTKKNEACAADRESAAQQQKTKMDEMDDCF